MYLEVFSASIQMGDYTRFMSRGASLANDECAAKRIKETPPTYVVTRWNHGIKTIVKVDGGAEGGSRTRTSFRTMDFKSRDRAIT